ncbi:zinc-binding dehydrogenase [uncultured Adlercreutzia sp.]|uniref:zinc-binding dehydrogenase n=1 Tax=uncultured Adlercreutzia sp. TaxID=875803 RepID=UPI0026F39071|nr:zinc-binding dehydrogenase [uncultured Adlercreutzia sp.]
MQTTKGVVIAAKGRMEVRDDCPLPDEPCPTGAFIRPLIWSPCTSDAHLCATGCEALPYLLGKAVGHEMCGEIVRVGSDVHDFKVGDRVIVDAVMPVWRSLEAQDGNAKNRSDNMYWGVDYPDRGGSFVETYYIRDADMNLARIPEGVTLDQAIMIPDMMCTAFEGVSQAGIGYGESVAIIGVGPVGLMALAASVLRGAGRVAVVGSRKICFDRARQLGATEVYDYHEEGYLERMLADNGKPFDAVIVCGGSENSIDEGLRILKNGGTLVNMSAYFGDKMIAIDPADWGFGYGDKTIKGVGCGGGRLLMERMAALIANGRVDPSILITQRFHGMDSVPEAMDLFLEHDRDMIKPVIYND